MIYTVITEHTKKLPVYLTSIGKENHETLNRTNGYNDFQISYIAKGKGYFSSEGIETYLCEGDCFVFRPNAPHYYESLSDDYCDYWVAFNGESADKLFDFICQGSAEVFAVENTSFQKMYFEKMLKEACETGSFYDEKLSVQLYSYILKTAENKQNHPFSTKKKRFVPILEYIENNYKNTITLDELAQVAKLSKYRFCGAFKEAFGIGAIKYIIQFRIQKSKELLLNNKNKTVDEIAKEVGFKDSSYFCCSFKKYENITPEQFRNFQKR